MSIDMDALMLAFVDLPEPLPAAALAGLRQVVQDSAEHRLSSLDHRGSVSKLRRHLIRRSELSAAEAHELAGIPLRRDYAVAYLCRPDVGAAQVAVELAALGEPDFWGVDVHAGLARASRNPRVLEHLVSLAVADNDSGGDLLHALASNRATPTAAAAAVVECAVERVCASGAPMLRSFSWLRFEHQVPTAAVERWALRSHRLEVLTVCTAERTVSAELLDHITAVAVDSVLPGGNVSPDDNAYQALALVVGHRSATAATRSATAALLQQQQLRSGRTSLAQALGLVPTRAEPLPGNRSWRNSTRKAIEDPAEARRLLDTLLATFGDQPTSWSVLARIGGEHTGTVSALAAASAAVTADPRMPPCGGGCPPRAEECRR